MMGYNSTFTTTIYLDDVPFEVTATFFPGEPMTYWEPGTPDDVEEKSISFCGVQFTDEQMCFFIEQYGSEEFYEWLLEESYNHIQDEQEAHADYLYEQWKDERKGVA